MSTSQSLIYPDTNIWNQLSKQNENPAKVLQALSAKGATLVLSPHTIYEYIKEGRLEATRFGKKYQITQESLEKYFKTPSAV